MKTGEKTMKQKSAASKSPTKQPTPTRSAQNLTRTNFVTSTPGIGRRVFRSQATQTRTIREQLHHSYVKNKSVLPLSGTVSPLFTGNDT